MLVLRLRPTHKAVQCLNGDGGGGGCGREGDAAGAGPFGLVGKRDDGGCVAHSACCWAATTGGLVGLGATGEALQVEEVRR